jgi:predicted DNA-binding transcriptional regulator YafY
MPFTKNALLRYRVIDKCLRNRYKPFPGMQDLREACEELLYGSSGEHISSSTIEKDLRDMRENALLGFFAPIKYSRVEKGFYYEDEDYSIDRKPLNSAEIAAIQFASETLMQFREAGVFSVFSSAIEKMFGQLHIVSSLQDSDMMEVIQFESIPKAKGLEWIPKLYDAIREKKEIMLQYRKFGSGSADRLIFHPYVLKEFRNRWYVAGFSISRQKIISLGLDRIQSQELTGDAFVRRDDFDAKSYFRDSYGITEAGLQAEQVILAFEPLQGPYLRSQPIHDSQYILLSDEKEFRISLKVRLTYELRQMILSYGPAVKVLEPASLADEIRDLHRRAAAF